MLATDSALYKNNKHSLAAHLNVISHVLSDVERAARVHVDNPEIIAMRKCILVDLFQRAGKRDFLDPTVAEAILIDTLHAFLNFDALQIVAIVERVPFHSLQR